MLFENTRIIRWRVFHFFQDRRLNTEGASQNLAVCH